VVYVSLCADIGVEVGVWLALGFNLNEANDFTMPPTPKVKNAVITHLFIFKIPLGAQELDDLMFSI
jgi:hypothetical protein